MSVRLPLIQGGQAPSSGEARRASPGGAPKLYVETYGCQMNVADSDLIQGLLAKEGFARAETPGQADVILVNTCAVREKAEEKVFARATELRAEKKRRPGVVLAIAGCMAEHLREGLTERAPWVDVVAGPDSYRRLATMVAEARAAEGRGDPLIDVHLDREETYEGLDPQAAPGAISAFVTIQRGCDKFCTFCVVPLTRGRERGVHPDEVVRQVRGLAAVGIKEITLLGQTVNSYVHDDVTFADLLGRVAAVDGIARVRFTSPYPVDFTDDVIERIADDARIMPHVHLPLQCGSDVVLERMARGYDLAGFTKIHDRLRERVPGIAITTDLLVGFSGETEEDHAATLAAQARFRFDAAFMFAYSERSGTQAARKLPDDVPEVVKQRRLREVMALQGTISSEVLHAQIGRVEDVLVHATSKRNADEVVGRTPGFKAVILPGHAGGPGDVVRARIVRATSATLFGEPV